MTDRSPDILKLGQLRRWSIHYNVHVLMLVDSSLDSEIASLSFGRLRHRRANKGLIHDGRA
jgi:hypothetical protein